MKFDKQLFAHLQILRSSNRKFRTSFYITFLVKNRSGYPLRISRWKFSSCVVRGKKRHFLISKKTASKWVNTETGTVETVCIEKKSHPV